MKLSGFLKYDESSKKKISLIAIIPKRSYGLNKKTKINRMLHDEPKISEHNKQAVNRLFYNSVFGAPVDHMDFAPSHPQLNLMSHPFKKIKKISESIQIENYKFSNQYTIKQKKLSRVAKNPVFKIKTDITTIPY